MLSGKPIRGFIPPIPSFIPYPALPIFLNPNDDNNGNNVNDDKLYDLYYMLLSRYRPISRINPYSFAIFIKLWKKEDNYNKESYNLFKDKIYFFFRLCLTFKILKRYFYNIFPYIFIGIAYDYFFI